MTPVVSVVVTTYNQAPYIEQTLDTVFAQTYKSHEVIVVDDGSTDDTPARLAGFKDRIRYLRQMNQGIAGSRNTGIRQAKGELVAFLDGDDLWEPEKLAIQVDAARTHPNSGLIVVDGVEFGDEGILRASLLGPCCTGLPEESVTTAHYYSQLLHECFISTVSEVMIPAKVFQAVGLSNQRFKCASDYDLYIRIAAAYDVTVIKKRLTRWRYLATSASGPRHLRTINWILGDIEVLKNQLREAPEEYRPLISRLLSTKILTAAESLYYHGRAVDRPYATRHLFMLLAENPGVPAVVPFLLGLWCPEAITSTLGPVVRKLLRSGLLGAAERTVSQRVSPGD